MADDRINAAVRNCLQQCYRSKDQIATVAAFIEHLKDSIGWTNSEIRSVELAVLRILGSVVHGVTYPGDATNQPIGELNGDRSSLMVDIPKPPPA